MKTQRTENFYIVTKHIKKNSFKNTFRHPSFKHHKASNIDIIDLKPWDLQFLEKEEIYVLFLFDDIEIAYSYYRFIRKSNKNKNITFKIFSILKKDFFYVYKHKTDFISFDLIKRFLKRCKSSHIDK